MSFPGNSRSSFSHPADPVPSFSRRYGSALRTVVAVSEARLGGGKLRQLCPGEREADPHAHRLRRGSGELDAGAFSNRVAGREKADPALAFNHRLGITAGCAAKTATARNSGSSTSPRRNTRTASSTLRTTTTAGSIDFPRAPSEFARGESRDAGARSAGGAAH